MAWIRIRNTGLPVLGWKIPSLDAGRLLIVVCVVCREVVLGSGPGKSSNTSSSDIVSMKELMGEEYYRRLEGSRRGAHLSLVNDITSILIASVLWLQRLSIFASHAIHG